MFRTKQTQKPDQPVVYPSGVCVETEKGWFYIKNGKRYRLPSDRVLASWNFHRVIKSSEAALARYRIAGKIGFRDGSLIYNISDGRLYLVSENKRRHITSPDALERIGATNDDAVVVSDEDTKIQEQGEDLN